MGKLFTLLTVVVVLISGYVFNGVTSQHEKQTLADDALRIAVRAQVWKTTPQAMGGAPSNQRGFKGLTFAQLGYRATNDNSYENRNGTYHLKTRGNALVITAHAHDITVVMVVTGTSLQDIETRTYTS